MFRFAVTRPRTQRKDVPKRRLVTLATLVFRKNSQSGSERELALCDGIVGVLAGSVEDVTATLQFLPHRAPLALARRTVEPHRVVGVFADPDGGARSGCGTTRTCHVLQMTGRVRQFVRVVHGAGKETNARAVPCGPAALRGRIGPALSG